MLVQQFRQIPKGDRDLDLKIFAHNLSVEVDELALNSKELLGVQLSEQEIEDALERENTRYFITSIANQETLLEIVEEELNKLGV